MPVTQEELIAQAVLDAQRRHQTSSHTELGTVLSSDAFSAMPLEQKAQVIKHYAAGIDHEPDPSGWQKAKAVAGGAVSGAVNTGTSTLLLGAIPFAMQRSMEGQTGRQIGTSVLKGMERVARPVLLLSAGMGAWSKYNQLKGEKSVRGYTNELLERIRSARDEEEANRNAYELLASSAHTHTAGQSVIAKSKKLNSTGENISHQAFKLSLAVKEPEQQAPTIDRDAIIEAAKRRLRGEEG